jgi:tRNA (guanine6-N2)-methyltransferase
VPARRPLCSGPVPEVRLHPTPLDASREIDDELVLRTVGGGVPFLAGDLARLDGAARTLERTGDTIRLRHRGSLRSLAHVRLYDVCGVALTPVSGGAGPDREAIVGRLRQSLDGGLLSALAAAGPLRFRVSPLGPARWEVRDLVARELGWVNDPGGWDVNLEVMGAHLVAQVGAMHWSRRFAKLARVPASTNPVVAALMTRLLAPDDGAIVLDPCCGAGTLLAEALAAAPRATAVGTDVSRPALGAARRNLRAAGGHWGLCRGDARQLPVGDRAVGRLVSNLPFGKRVGSHRDNLAFYPAFLAEAERVLDPAGRAVVLTEEKRLFRRAVAATRSLRVESDLTLETGGLHPSVFVLVSRAR